MPTVTCVYGRTKSQYSCPCGCCMTSGMVVVVGDEYGATRGLYTASLGQEAFLTADARLD